MTPIKIGNFLPPPSEVPPETVLAVRERFVRYMQEWWPELDTRPNSVFGDLYLTPMATMTAALEIAYSRRDSDLNLANVAQGIIFDPEFVDAFLSNFGANLRGAIQASGLIRLTLSADQTYVFDSDTVFTFNGRSFRVRPEEGNPVVLRGTQDSNSGRRLTRAEDSFYMVLLPVVGIQGAVVVDQQVGATSWTEPKLVSVTAVGDFDPGSASDSLVDRAIRARYLFAAATLTSRAGAESFIRSLFPGVLSVSAVVTSDPEMLRDGANILAVSEGAIDLYVRSRRTYARNQTRTRLTYDSARQAWIGALPTASTPAFFSSSIGVFRADTGPNERSLVKVYARSLHKEADGLGVAYSSFEQFGLEVTDASPERFEEARNSAVVIRSGDESYTVLVSGQYGGSIFGQNTGRRVSLRYEGAAVKDSITHAVFIVRDLDTNEAGTILFAPNTAVAPTYARMLTDSQDARKFFNGLDLQLLKTGTFGFSGLAGMVLELSFYARSSEFLIDYQFDPALPVIEQTVNGGDNKPVGVSVMVKSFIICHVNKLVLVYKSYPGGSFSQTQARLEVADYINGLSYPDRYDNTALGSIVVRNGASGLVSVQVSGRFYPSMAHTFVDKLGQETQVYHPVTDTLLPPPNAQNFGSRNISYLVDMGTIEFISDAG